MASILRRLSDRHYKLENTELKKRKINYIVYIYHLNYLKNKFKFFKVNTASQNKIELNHNIKSNGKTMFGEKLTF